MIDLVGREDLRDAIALNSSGFNLARVFGPAVGAAIIARWGIAWCFAANAASYLTVLVGLALIQLPRREYNAPQDSPWAGMREGVALVRHDPRLRGLVEVISVVSILATPTLALMPVMAREQLGLGAGGYGVLLSAVGIGGLAGALSLAASSRRLPRGQLLMRSQLACSVLLVALSLARTQWVAYILLLGIGFFFITNSALGNTIMHRSRQTYRGRLMSIYSLIVVGLPQVVGASRQARSRARSISWSSPGGALMLLYSNWAFRRYPEIRTL
jgi:predicted MFS family arabinose efflux permease